MEALTPGHLIIVLIGFVVLFGYKKLPDASRALGRSLRIFKSELRSMTDDATAAPAAVPPAAPTPSPASAPTSVAQPDENGPRQP